MYKLDFNIDEVLGELQGMSVKEKIAALEEISDDLDSALNDIINAELEIEEQYFSEHRKKIFESIKASFAESKIENIKVENDAFYLPCKGKQVAVFPLYADGDWFVYISPASVISKNVERIQFYLDLENVMGVKMKDGDDSIIFKVKEEDVEHKMIEVMDKLSSK